jgi:hypothetical protein
MEISELIERYGTPYSEELGIRLGRCDAESIFKWFLASLLFGARISEAIAAKTYRKFVEAGVTSAAKVLEKGYWGLVELLDAGGYVRYDFKTADKLLGVCANLYSLYRGDMNELHSRAKDSTDLERRIKSLGKGIGDVTLSIFLREMRWCWGKAKPRATPLERAAMKKLGIKDVEKFAEERGVDIVRLETALVRLGKELRRRKT